MDWEVNLGRASREELIQLVSQLLDHVEALEARISELEGRQKPPTEGGKERKPPSWAKANRPTVPRRNAIIGPTALPGGGRSPPTGWSNGRVRTAGHCCWAGGCADAARLYPYPPRVRHVVLERTCRKCGQRWSPEPDWSALVVGRQRVLSPAGCSARSAGFPMGDSTLPEVGYRLGLSVGELVALVRGVARLGQEEYNQLQQEIRLYGDETGWREDGRNGYLWSFSNPEVRYFLRRGSRGSKVVEEVLGDEFDGVLVSDFYGAYNVHQGLHQRCWTHLLRDIHQLKERYPQHQGLAQWAQQVREVYDQAQACPGPDPELPETVQRAQRVKATAVSAAAMVHLQALPWQRCAHERAVPTGGTLPAGAVHLRRRAPG